MIYLMLAMEATTTVVKEVPVDGTNTWKLIAVGLFGAFLAKVVSWAASWFDGKGAQFVQARLAKFEEKVDATSVGAQIQADNALFDIAQKAIPEVMTVLSQNVKKDLEDGKFDKVEWQDIGSKLWAATKEHVQGGAHDYIKNSSFQDGQVAMAWIAKKLFHQKQVEKENG